MKEGGAALAVPVSYSLDGTEKLLLLFTSPREDAAEYPTDRLQKGWLISCAGKILVEEGIGFALPMVRYGHRTVFPASARLAVGKSDIGIAAEVTYELALEERLAIGKGKSINNQAFYRAREYLSAIHRKMPPLRKGLTVLFDGARALFHLRTRFEPGQSVGIIKVTTIVRPGEGKIAVNIDCDLEKRGCTEIIIANEQGASYFNLYRDSANANLEKAAIGSWGEVTADNASLIDRSNGVLFALSRVTGARLFRGWEMTSGRLAWAGLNYVLPPGMPHFEYEIRIGEL